MARVTAAEAARTREKLLDAALEVFWKEGVARPSLTKVGEQAGMTRGAVYGHFANKNALFNALCDRYLLPAAVLEEHRQAGADDPFGTLTAWVAYVLEKARFDREQRMLLEILFLKCEAVEGDDVRERLQEDSEPARHHEHELLSAAVARGQLPADLDVDAATVAVHTLVGGMIRFYALNSSEDATPLLARVEPLLLDMLRGTALRRDP